MWTYQQFLQYLKDVGNNKVTPFGKLPAAIDFGLMATVTHDMTRRTTADWRSRERMRRVQVCGTVSFTDTPQLKVQIDSRDTIGSKTQVMVETAKAANISYRTRSVSVTQHVGIIHTHPNDSPFSPQDCCNLLHNQAEGRIAVMLLGTANVFMALLISSDTPAQPEMWRQQFVAVESSIVRHQPLPQVLDRLLAWCQRFSVAAYSLPWRKQTTVAHRISA